LAVVIQYTANISAEEYDEIVAGLRVHDDPPAGLILHSAYVTDDEHVRAVEVWRSRALHDRYAESRLQPVIESVLADERARRDIRYEVHELYSLVTPGPEPIEVSARRFVR
jgi:hypothetical protein